MKLFSSFLLQQSKNYVYKNIGNQIYHWAQSDPSYLSLNYSVHERMINNNEYVFLTDSISAEMMIRKNCDLDFVVATDGVPIPYTVDLPKGSAYTRLFNE